MNTRNLIEDIVRWIYNYANGKSLVVGISGGIDSSVVSTLCCRTGLPTYAVSLPLQNSEEHTHLSQVHGRFLQAFFSENVQHITLPLEKPFQGFQTSLETLLPNIPTSDHAFANLKSRLRMTALYAIASSTNGLVVGTGNRIEDFGVGFYTKYGDGGVDISPIADLYKSDVYRIAKELELDLAIQEAKPSDGLHRDARLDEQQLGYDYPTLEKVMKMHERGEYPTKELRDAYNKYAYWNTINKHKMESIPVYKVSSEYRIRHEVHNKCGTEDCCSNDMTKDKEVYVSEDDGDVGC
jgi:NAD+ synthase